MPRKRRAPAPDQTACVVYARFSSDRQRDESIDDQVAVCARWADEHGLAVVGVYADRALSGTSDERPQFLRMVEDAARGAFCAVVVYKLDRFSRDRYDTAIYRKRLRDCGVRVESATEAIPDSPEGLILESMIAGMNEYYVRNLAQNVRRGMAGNAERCMANGNAVWGYRTGADGRYEVDERQAPYVRRAFEMLASGASRRDVLDWLAGEGVTNSRGKPMNYGNLATMVANEKYVGVYSWGDVRVEGGMPAIVDEETFRAAQGCSPRAKPRQNSFPLSGRLVDRESGRPYRGTSGTSSSGRRYLYYSVPDGRGHELRWPKEAVEDAVSEVLAAAFREPAYADSMAEAAVAAMCDQAGAGRAGELRAELADVARRESNLLAAAEAGVGLAGLAERSAELSRRREAIERDLAAIGELPGVAEVSEWIRRRFAEVSGREALAAVRLCAIDGDGRVYVEVPWRIGPQMLENAPDAETKKDERAGRSAFAQMVDGSPYQIRTGDLRLERAAS